MKVFTCRDFAGFWPVGASAVIVAPNLAEAKERLYRELTSRGLGEKNADGDFTVEELNTNDSAVIVLQDGDY